MVSRFAFKLGSLRVIFANRTVYVTHTLTKVNQALILQKYLFSCRKMKLETPEFQAILTPELKSLAELFSRHNYEIRIAGGAVRDLLTGKEPHDIDFATTATPQQMQEMFQKEGIRMINNKGEKHGTVTCRINDKENFEVTTLRVDVTTDGRHAEVEFTRDWQLDSERRDLTINSMFLDFEGTLYDYFNGKEDLERHIVRFVGDSAQRIQEDYLRILRYFRFFGRISDNPNTHEDGTLKSIRDNVEGLSKISGERIWVEIKKITEARHVSSLLRVMSELGVLTHCGFPKNLNLDELDRVWKSSSDLNMLPMTVLSSLLNSEPEVYSLHERVKMSKDELSLGVFIVNHRLDEMGSDPFEYCQDVLCDTPGAPAKTKQQLCKLLKYRNLRDTMEKLSEYQLPKFPVNGIRLIEMGVEKGPKFAKVLAMLREKWRESRYTLTEDELLKLVKTPEKSKT